MLFASPLWLIALLPWAGAALWLLWGRRKKTFIPFLDLWRGPALQKPAKRALQPPPIFLALAIFATALALVAAARPQLKNSRAGTSTPVTIIVDRGITMSAMPGSVPRFVTAARNAEKGITPLLPDATRIDLLVLPVNGPALSASNAPQLTAAGDWTGKIERLAPTAIDTQASVEKAVRDRLASTTGPVVLISDRQLGFDNPRLIRFSSDIRVDNVGITHLAARETPVPQVMVRVRNDSDRTSVPLKVISGDRSDSRTIELPPRGQERDYFVDFDHFDAKIEAALDVHDDQPADDRMWLLREGSEPKIEAAAPLSPQLRRIVDVFTQKHPPADSSTTVAIVAADAELPATTLAVLIAPSSATAKGTVAMVAHDVTANVDWSALPRDMQTAGDCPTGWTPLVTVGNRVIVAVRTEPVRKVWIGFDAPSWPERTDFVIFWANVFTWTGQGRERFASYPLADFEGPWKMLDPPPMMPMPAAGQWPSIYQSPEGALRAFYAPPADRGRSMTTTADWQHRMELALDTENGRQRGYDIAPLALVFASTCLAGASATWKRPRRTGC